MLQAWLKAAAVGGMPPAELFARMGEAVAELYVPVQVEGGVARPLVATPADSRPIAILFSAPDHAEGKLPQGARVQPTAMMNTLQNLLRSDFDGLVIDPGSDHEIGLNRDLVTFMFRAYAMEALRTRGKAWGFQGANGLQAIELQNGILILPLYLTEEDAKSVLPKEEEIRVGEVGLSSVWERFIAIGADAVNLQAGLPEQAAAYRRELGRAAGHPEGSALDQFEDAMATLDASAVAAEMVKLERLWALVAPEGGLLSTEGYLPLFTSGLQALTFVTQSAAAMGVEPPRARAQQVQVRPLLEGLGDDLPKIGVNIGIDQHVVLAPDVVRRALARGEGEQC